MDGVAEPPRKKLKEAEHQVFLTFKKNEKSLKSLRDAIVCIANGFSLMNVCFLKLDIADPPKCRSFSQANCHTKNYPTTITIGSLFPHGLKLLLDYIQNPLKECLPEHESSKEALKQLLLFLSEEPPAEIFEPEKYKDDEVSWAVILAEHLFSKLSIGDHYILDKHYPGKNKLRTGNDYVCACKKKEKISGWFGDTSFGCTRGWHGSVDILINNEVPASVILGEQDEGTSKDNDESCSDSSESSIEFKTTERFNSDQNMQLISQCIVFSFLQFKQDPTLNHYLIPLIGVCRNKMKIQFYDCENDILLTTTSLILFGKVECRFVPQAIVLLWFVLNYKLFSTGVPEGYHEYKSDFPVFARDLMHHYREEVKYKIRRTREDDEKAEWATWPGDNPKTTIPLSVCVSVAEDSDSDELYDIGSYDPGKRG